MAGPFEFIVARLEAAHRAAEDLVAAGDVRFAAVVDNLDRLLALPRDDSFPAAAARARWVGLPLHVDRGGGWTEPLTPAIDEIEWGPCWQPDPELVARCEPERLPEPEPGEVDLYELLASYFGDQSTEAGVREVVFVTADHPEWHRRYLAALDRGIAAAAAGDPEVARVIMKSFAASVRDAGEARAYLEEVRAAYLRLYEDATRA